jgi:hypothetical protein
MAAATQKLAPGASSCPDLPGLLARNDVDALVIASPNHMHIPQLRTVAATRPLPVLVEKPLFTRRQDEAALREIARDFPAPIWVAMGCPSPASAIREHRFPFLPRSATGTASTATPAARWSRSAATSST